MNMHQRGIAFILVLWVVTMLSILLGSFALLARTENLQSRHLFDATTARYAAEAGLNLAVYQLHQTTPEQRWMADGRPYAVGFANAQVEVEITDDSGKININLADAVLLKGLFTAAGADENLAVKLADAVQDWRDSDDLVQAQGAEEREYRNAGLSYQPKNAPFSTVSELQQVLGMDYELYRRVEPAITIYSGSNPPNAAYAPLLALQALPGMTAELAQQLIQQRQALPPGGQMAEGATALTLPDGTPIIASSGGNTYSIKSRATLPNGAQAVLDATIRMGGINPAGRPYVVFRWRDSENS